MFKNYLEYIQVILLIHMKGMCSPEKVFCCLVAGR